MDKIALGNDERFYYIPKYRSPVEEQMALDPFKPYSEQDVADFEAVRKKLMSRVFAIDKLLERYKKVLSEEQIEGIEDSLNQLRKKVRKLKMASTLNDTIVKTANILKNKYDFKDGADILLSLAQEPVEEQIPGPQGAGQQQELQSVIEQLYILSNQIKNRRIIRELAEIDLRLHRMGMATFFPEIGEAQAKLIDAFTYAGNKVDDILPKLQGGLALTEAEEEVQEAPQEVAPEDQLTQEVQTMARETEVPETPEPEMEMTVPLAGR